VIEADVRRRVACRGRLSVQTPVPGTTSGGELQPCIVAVKTHGSTSCWTRVVTAQSTWPVSQHHPSSTSHEQLEGKYSLESTDPRESEIRAPRQLTIAFKLSYYLFIIAKLFKVKGGCLKFVYIGKNPRFTAFLDSNLHTRLAIITENELGFAFPPRNLPKKFRPDPSTFHLLIVVTNRQKNRQTDKRTPVIT